MSVARAMVRAWLPVVVGVANAVDPAAYDRMWAWAEDAGAEVSQLRSADYEWGRGLEAVGCEEGGCEELFFLPNRVLMSCMTITSGMADFEASMGLTRGANGCDEVVFETNFGVANGLKVLALFLAHEAMRGGESFFAPYIATLGAPTSPSYALAVGASGRNADEVWGARDVRRVFAPSRYAERHLDRRAQEWLEIAGLASRSVAGVDVDVARRTVLWALATVDGRSVNFGGPRGHTLAPFWDLINHGDEQTTVPNAQINFLWPEGLSYAQDTYRRGQLLHNYSFISPCPVDWIKNYGFVPRELAGVARRPLDAAEELGLGFFAPGCGEVDVDGRTFDLPLHEAALVAHANESRAHAARTRRALAARSDALPPDDVLNDMVDAALPPMQRNAALLMLLERRALKRTAARVDIELGVDSQVTPEGPACQNDDVDRGMSMTR